MRKFFQRLAQLTLILSAILLVEIILAAVNDIFTGSENRQTLSQFLKIKGVLNTFRNLIVFLYITIIVLIALKAFIPIITQKLLIILLGVIMGLLGFLMSSILLRLLDIDFPPPAPSS